MSVPLLAVEGLGIRFPIGGWPNRKVLRAVHDVSFTVERGEIVALVGESGSGKSTIGRAITRLLPVQAGAIRLDGDDVLVREPKGASMAFRRRVQLIFQDPFASLNPVHPVGHGVARALLLHGRAGPENVDARVETALASVGLGAEMAGRYPFALSGGQRQRASIARALVVEPDLIVADEPTSMLDVSIRMDVLRLFRRLRESEGRSVLLITHDLASARIVADRVVVLYAGQVMEQGPAQEVLARPRHPYARLLSAASRRGGGLREPLPARPGSPQVVNPGPGCPFAARCLSVEERCRTTAPPAVTVAPTHTVRCHLAEAP